MFARPAGVSQGQLRHGNCSPNCMQSQALTDKLPKRNHLQAFERMVATIVATFSLFEN